MRSQGFLPPLILVSPEMVLWGEASPNSETVVVGDVDLEILRRGRNNGTVTQLKDRRRDLFALKFDNKIR